MQEKLAESLGWINFVAYLTMTQKKNTHQISDWLDFPELVSIIQILA